jgi:hypothetical protein
MEKERTLLTHLRHQLGGNRRARDAALAKADAILSLLSASTVEGREGVARVIDPMFGLYAKITADLEAKAATGPLDPLETGQLGGNRRARDAALAKADAILSLLSASTVEG